MRRWRLITLLTLLAALLVGCGRSAPKLPDDIASSLAGGWHDTRNGWSYHFGVNGSYRGAAPPVADGVREIAGAYELSEDGYLTLTLAESGPLHRLRYFGESHTWQIAELTAERLVLRRGRARVTLERID